MPSYFLAFITALIAVYALTPLVIKFAVKTGAMDKPDPRKVHKKPNSSFRRTCDLFGFHDSSL